MHHAPSLADRRFHGCSLRITKYLVGGRRAMDHADGDAHDGAPSPPSAVTAATSAVARTTRLTRDHRHDARGHLHDPRDTATTTSCGIPSALFGKDLTAVPGTAKVVALTFDAGANANGVAPILATLSERQATGTFFLTGAFVGSFPAASRQIAATYPVGNHTQNHQDLTRLTTAQVLDEIRTGQHRSGP